ncbi:MAG TPA: PHP domain-containing protein [Thermotogota bacterium]|nr:PHP domain-containing protein [Thermotogota bacterium]HPJ88423.1 PHP domain-containing protein [Thermotogota bacterium]HPR95410.1 PHP domain-containing protein [Thermotogota bacterium]
MNPFIDLHNHTINSDGEKSPDELLCDLISFGVTHFSITDHDCITWTNTLAGCCREKGIRIISGIELSAGYEDGEVHILGYKYDPNDERLRAFTEERAVIRKERALLMINNLRKRFFFDEEAVNSVLNAPYVGRPQIAQLLLSYGYIDDYRQAFEDDLIGNTGKNFVLHRLEPVETVIQLLKKAGALVFIAHPGIFSTQMRKTGGMNRVDIKRFFSFGIDGIEVFHPGHNMSQIQKYLSLAEQGNLLISMGSDYHRGDYAPQRYAFNPQRYVKDVISWVEEK